MKKAMILYARYGGGHISAANSITEYLRNHYPDIEPIAIDYMAYLNKVLDKLATSAYEEVLKKAPGLWGSIYAQSDSGPLARLSADTNKLLAYRLRSLIEEHDPQYIISTHPFSSQMCAFLRQEGKLPGVRLATVMTDFASHDQWLIGSDQIDYFFVAHGQLRQELIDRGVAPEKVFAVGIPTAEKFLLPYNEAEIRRTYGLDENKFTILFFAGGMLGLCSDQTISIFEDMARYLDDVQIVVVSGKNTFAFESFCEIVHRYHREQDIRVLAFTDRVPDLMHVSDIVITKPGGLTISESICCGLPLILINPLPGQEEQNAKYLEERHMGRWIRKDDTPIGVIFQIIKTPHILADLKQNVEPFRGHCATRKICSQVFSDCERVD